MKKFLTFLLLFLVITSSGIFAQSACPQVTIAPASSICSGQCENLTATVQGSVATTSYNVSNIAYAPYAFTGGNPVLVNIDDTWSSVVTMPFCFQFFGNTYTQFVIGSNALISFDITQANAYCQWPINAAIPTNTNPMNSIMAPYHDIDPSVGTPTSATDINWAVYGTAPCRYMVVNWNDVAMFSCTTLIATSQLVLHETTNIIDVYIQNKPLCASWNAGAAIEGIQNSTGTVAYWVAGRNYPTQWTASNDGKRFTPSGAPQYTLNWTGPSGNLGSANPLNVCPTTTSTYTCTVTNTTCAGNVVVSSTVTVPVTSGLTVAGTQINSTSCLACNGSATTTVTAGTGPFTYAWTPSGGNAATSNNLCVGTYTCTVTGAGGCTGTQVFTITGPSPPTSTQAMTNVTCNGGCNGTGTITPNPAGAYTYAWSPSGGTAATASGLCAGTYTVTATNAGGCTTTQTITITQPTVLAATVSTTAATCGGNNGSATVSPSGGTGPYSYSWAPSGGTGATANSLVAGTYTCTVTDASGCTTTATAIVGSSGGITAATTATVNVSCNGGTNGSSTASPTGGTGPYTYAWSPSGGNAATANNLAAGNYTCTITDANGCIATTTVTITQPVALTAIQAHTNVTCNGGNNGSATVTASGGTGPYTYAWSPSGGNAATANNLAAGNYTCTITDANGCTTTQLFTITQPTLLTSTNSTTLATCGNSNGSATVTASGGTGPYTYSWSPAGGNAATANNIPAGTYTCTITDASGCTQTSIATVNNSGGPVATMSAPTNVSCFGGNNGSANVTVAGGTVPFTYSWSPIGGTSATGANLTAGNYTVTVTDANGCITTSSAVITQPTALTITGTSSNVDCFGNSTGTASVIPGGGSPAYTYAWSPAGGNAANANPLTAGSYTCTVTDLDGCIITQTFSITEPPQLTLAVAGFNVTCFNACDGQIVSIPSGGVPGYTFNWSTGCSAASCNNICAGNYTCTVTDANGCIITNSATVTQPTALSIATSEVDAHCNQSDGSATATGSGGTGTLNYQWTGGPSNANWNNISAGTYWIIVTDQNNCIDSTSVTVNNIAGVNASLQSVSNISCNGACNGIITGTSSGGTGILTYSWSPSGGNTLTTNPVCAGNYTLTVTDAVGCTATFTAAVTQPPPLTVTATANPPSLCAGSSTSISCPPAGGTPAYNITWMPGNLSGANQTVSPNVTTTYSVVVTDANGCMDSTNVTVTVNANPVATLAGDSLSGCAPHCVNFSDLSTVSNGNITQWSWDFGDGNNSTSQNPVHCYITAGNYTIILTVSTSTGCTNTITMNNYISVFAIPVADFTSSPQPTTELDPTLFFTDASQNASSWMWNFGDTTNATSILQSPSYMYGGPGCFDVTLTVTSSNGCMDSTVHPICIDPDVTIFVPNAFTPNGDGVNETFFAQGVGIDPDKFELWIFDRWGNLIFYSKDMNKGWNGKVQGHEDLCQIDTYVWKIKAVDVLGHKHNLIGKVSLVR
ncbi:MAG: gliding motility-associated C-terminal domain-containing protein [Bacteroidetes bacterium]|nr:gliding motility-associated C-terminal domain-containing protein [Bacteroidota bacterium]